MKAIVGLGNPGPQYENTRHNAGWKAISLLADEFGANYWKTECGAEVAHCKKSGFSEEILLVKPQSYMNLSGGPVKNLCDKYKLSIDDLIIIHDDMDIEPGSIRVKCGGSSAGHNGLKSLTAKLNSDKYIRVRVGIGHAPGQKPVVDYVLEEPRGKLAKDFETSFSLAAEATIFLLDNPIDRAQQKYNSKNNF